MRVGKVNNIRIRNVMTMKSFGKYLFPVVGSLVAAVLLAGCASSRMRRLSGSDFVNQAGQIEQINSAHWTTYIGCSAQRAYLEFGYPACIGGGARTVVYWTPLAELPDDLAHKLTIGAPPWKPWFEKRADAATPGVLPE